MKKTNTTILKRLKIKKNNFFFIKKQGYKHLIRKKNKNIRNLFKKDHQINKFIKKKIIKIIL